ncbi:SigB/SigF/SigG family RNA polymerase sigma factor [Streptomyces sp. NPDC101227]|uniref:SigB/SigF/SigG family RNA polymerase sigma factor n=1 Tax=Streptomyces sp. NPDC101227 TaxID=3366136 RepID=UPI00382BA216
MTMAAAREPTGTERSADLPSSSDTCLPTLEEAYKVAPKDARRLSKLFFERLEELEEGTPQHQYARNTLVEMNLSLVRYAARRFRSSGRDMEDVVQVGTIGLIKSIDRFDISRGNEFTTFAVPCITGEIRRHFRDTAWAVHVPRRLQELRIELARAREELEATGINEPTASDFARHLDLPEREVRDGLVACNGYDAGSIHRPIQASSGGQQQTGLVADLIGQDDPALDLAENLQALKPLLEELDDRERNLLELRFGAEKTQAEIGNQLGLSQMHVSRLLTRTLSTLRARLFIEE